jgi:hypothetical protein
MAEIDKGGGAPALSLDELRAQDNDIDVDILAQIE